MHVCHFACVGDIVAAVIGPKNGEVPMAAQTIPTIDLSPLRSGSEAGKREVARQIDDACTDIGFFMVVGHGVPQDLITTTRQRAIDFFALPVEEKMKVQRPPAKISRGYNWVGDRSLSYTLGQAAPPDIQEAFAFGPDDVAWLASHVDPVSAKMYAPNIWPERPHDFQERHACLLRRHARIGRACASRHGGRAGR